MLAEGLRHRIGYCVRRSVQLFSSPSPLTGVGRRHLGVRRPLWCLASLGYRRLPNRPPLASGVAAGAGAASALASRLIGCPALGSAGCGSNTSSVIEGSSPSAAPMAATCSLCWCQPASTEAHELLDHQPHRLQRVVVAEVDIDVRRVDPCRAARSSRCPSCGPRGRHVDLPEGRPRSSHRAGWTSTRMPPRLRMIFTSPAAGSRSPSSQLGLLDRLLVHGLEGSPMAEPQSG